ncbi:PEP-CTERM sorting domain-containing protein [Aliiglaciecola sp. SL4]|uniref:PEP-CTERM sorting domain-containing protein n=1 Tax=Aliiglaciecola sp. SL4 TaxID=3239806 RepID=UPI00355C0E4B
MNKQKFQQYKSRLAHCRRQCLTGLMALIMTTPIFAGPIVTTDYDSTVVVTLENLNKNIDDLHLKIGDVSHAGAVLGYYTSSQNARQVAADSYIRYEDSFGSNVGSYEATIVQSGNSDGFSYASDIASVNAAEGRSPLVALNASVYNQFSVTEATKARINVAISGNTFAGRNYVGLQIDGYGDNGEFVRLYSTPSRFGSTEITGTDSFEITLQEGFTYELTGESRGSTLYSAPHGGQAPPSSLAYSLLTAQSLLGNSAENSLKPAAINYTGVYGTDFAHKFLLDSDEVEDLGGSTVWIDPEVATGYDYSFDGAGLLGIDLPDFSLFANATYQLFDLSGNLLADLFSGDSFDFSSVVEGFSLRGIDPDLALDPYAPGFTIGLRFETPDMSTILITQTPITETVDVNAIPAPSVLWLLLSGGAAMLMVRRKQA